ncbi:unnamed protein product [Cuscuta campestris]|uniref:Uncharacterized protein n=1 Tax=Cuscuta campestris TaxID=132261 RepID=A0A484KND3_9ASTE|nr:unnamed protein product [Cuscuta campestris]
MEPYPILPVGFDNVGPVGFIQEGIPIREPPTNFIQGDFGYTGRDVKDVEDGERKVTGSIKPLLPRILGFVFRVIGTRFVIDRVIPPHEIFTGHLINRMRVGNRGVGNLTERGVRRRRPGRGR